MMIGRKVVEKGAVVKSWMVVSETGETHLEDVGKQSIMKRTGVNTRDLRLLDPKLSYPSCILGRDRAIIVNLEYIKAIVTANEVLMVNSSDASFLSFIQHLLTRLTNFPDHQTPTSPICNDIDGDSEENSQNGSSVRMSEDYDALQDNAEIANVVASVTAGPMVLPFEFKALEACIESACQCLLYETSTLEMEAYPTLDDLTSQRSKLNLERVRRIKSRLVSLAGRVQKIADQLEHLLDDDNEMAKMYLTQKLYAPQLDQESLKESYEANWEKSDKLYGPKLEVKDLEMLLEAYFVQTDGILQNLSTLSKYVDDTEAYITVMLDDKRNQVLQLSIIFIILNLIVSAGIVVTGAFGMNITIELFDQNGRFMPTCYGTLGGLLLIFLLFYCWGQKRYMLFH